MRLTTIAGAALLGAALVTPVLAQPAAGAGAGMGPGGKGMRFQFNRETPPAGA